MLKRTIAIWILIGLPAVAHAQSAAPLDLNSPAVTPAPSAPAPPRVPSARRWQGFYISGFVGSANGSSDVATTTVFSTTGYFASSSVPAVIAAGAQSFSNNEVTYGGSGGYDFHIGRVVFGGEADYSAMNLSGSVISGEIYPCCAPTSFTITQTVDTNWLATVRVRGGVTFGPLLVFGTFGMAWTDLNYESVFTDTFASAHENGGNDRRLSSSIWSAGAELWCTRHISLRGEYLSTEFDPASTTSTNLTAFTPSVAFPTNVFTHSNTLKVQIFRGGVTVRF